MDRTFLFKKSSIVVKSGLGVVQNHWGEVKNTLIAVKNCLGVLQKDFFVVRIGPAKDKKAVKDV